MLGRLSQAKRFLKAAAASAPRKRIGAAAAGSAALAVGYSQQWTACDSGPSATQACGQRVVAVYEPPPRFRGSFQDIGRMKPVSEAGRLVWSVKNLELDELERVLAIWPQGAELIDNENNSLFHLLATEARRFSAQPEIAQRVLDRLLQHGWTVVDMKNANGKRAEVVAGLSRQGSSPNAAELAFTKRSRAFQEALRVEKPLQLVGESSPVSLDWQYPVQDEQRRSFAGVLKRAVPAETCARWMNDLIDANTWTSPPDVPRRTAWFVSSDCSDCPYKYSGLEYPAVVYPPFMQEIRDELCRLCGIPRDDMPNSCNVNLYSNHLDEVGWHSDDEVYFQSLSQDTRILSFSIGCERDFCWRLQGTSDALGSVGLGDGDIMTMEGLFQKHYKHSVPQSLTAMGSRANFTFRWIRVKAHAEDASTQARA